MLSDIEIRWASADETAPILNFIEAMGFNPRDNTAWQGLEMVAMSAWQGGNLIGAIPLEPRPLKITADKTIWAMHETVVAVHPDHRARGIGSAMQQQIFTSLPDEIELLSVFREEPQSPAYRWYLKNGFQKAMQIDSWFFEGKPEWKMPEVDLFVPTDSRVPWEFLAETWRKAQQTASGVVDQTQRNLRDWLAIHPYRARYNFKIAAERGRQGRAPGYAILGTGNMHSERKRCDILDLISTGGPGDVRHMLDQIIPFEIKIGSAAIRWPLAQTDSHAEIAQAIGFQRKWSFDMLIRPLPHSSFNLLPSSFASYASIDYI